MYEVQKFNGETVKLSEKNYNQVANLLLKTGKFINFGGEIINISEIKGIRKEKANNDYDVSKINL